MCNDVFIPKGISVPALNREKEWEFVPSDIKVGDHIAAGDVYGTIVETPLVDHKLMMEPTSMGKVTYLAPMGNYRLDDVMVEAEFNGVTKK